MDSLKISKSSSSSSTNNASSPSTNKPTAGQTSSSQTTVPITVRFNAGDECIDDIFQSFHTTNTTNTSATNTGSGGGGGGVSGSTIGSSNTNNTNITATGASGGGGGGGDSLSTSPSQHHQNPINNPDEVNTRNNFLQGNFFNRKSGLTGNKQQLSPNHPCPPQQQQQLEGGAHSPSSPIPPHAGAAGGGGGNSPYNGSQAGGSSGGVSPNSNVGISPNKYRRSISFPAKGGTSPTPGYTLDINAAQAVGVPTLSIGNGSISAGATGGGDAPPFMGAGPYMPNGLDMRPLDHCLNDIMRMGMGAVGPGGDNNVTAAAIMAERMRNQKMSEHHLGEVDAVAIAAGNGATAYLDPNMKLNSPSRSSPHSQGSDHTARFSRKVFVGGLPPDIDEDEITSSFRRFGPLVVDWPHKAESKSYFPPKGYAFLLFQDENSVQQLIDSCITDDDKLYLCVSSPTIKDKPVQIRPWRLADADYVLDATMSLDPRKTVFVGGVPRPLKAFELAMIMDRLYGGVCYAGIDTDPELKYPKGAGRVAFSNQQSYIAAISARFVQLQHGDIDKRVEVKPYVLDDQMCDECEGQRCGSKFAPFFCANVTCLQYYCEHCWSVIHSRQGRSIEGISPTSVGPNLIAALSSSDATSIGTWRMIKGKVSQTIEDIKSSKGSTTNITTLQPQSYPTIIIKGGEHQQQTGIEFDSDQETKTSMSEDLSVEQDRRSSGGSGKHKRSSKLEDSDSEFENEILLEGESEHSRFRRGFAHLKSKVKAKHAAHQAQRATLSTASAAAATVSSPVSHSAVTAVKKDISPSRSTGSSSSSTSLRGNFLRRRRNKGVETAELASPTNMASALAATVAASGEMAAAVPVVVSGKPAKKPKGITVGKKDIEIESGVEMLEDMIPPATAAPAADDTSPDSIPPKRDELNLPLQSDNLNTPPYKDYTLKSIKMLYECQEPTNMTPNESRLSSDSAASLGKTNQVDNKHFFWDYWYQIVKHARYLPCISIMGLVTIFILPLNDFIRGVLTCLLSITIVDGLWNLIQTVIERYTIHFKPEKTTFHIPDYSKMTICEVPAVKEYKTVKSYGGWMNEIDSYDPNTFSINMARSVYIKLEGTVLHISTTNARIPKRVMWNELPINRKTIIFTTHRTYDLLGCRIELLPIGLARKRHFNRKYPIQLIIKDTKTAPSAEDDDIDNKPLRRRFSRHRNKREKSETKELAENSSGKLNETETQTQESGGEMDFGATILNADLQKLQDDVNPDEDLNNITVPCGDEVRILLFARCAREKEDWYRRFVAASCGDVHDQDLHLSNVKLINSKDLQAAATKAAQLITNPKPKENIAGSGKSSVSEQQRESTSSLNFEDLVDLSPAVPEKEETERDDESIEFMPDDAETIEGLLMLASAARNDANYIKFMALYQKACRQSKIPVYKGQIFHDPLDKKSNKRTARHENELWKGIDQSLFLGPSGSVVWANVLIGRLLYSTLQNEQILDKIQDILQKKLNSIKLPSFMEDVVIKNIDLGTTPPLIHRVSQPMLDERGIWLDMDVTYEGHCHITVTTKMNLLRLKRPMRTPLFVDTKLDATIPNSHIAASLKDELLAANKAARGGVNETELLIESALTGSAIFDSDAESTGSSSTESDSPIAGTMGENPNSVSEGATNPGNARRIFKFVDRIATSNFFQSATELSFVQKAMENMSTTITLGIDLRGLVSRVTINIPPPPSDRIWLAFRAPPRLWLTARPTVGDKSVDWSIVTNVIEGKLCEAVNKYLVYPNMVDLTVPFLGKSAASES
ncbi:putative RNA-binding protein orb2 [Lucilia cuprina]|uniref:Putative RNA-binding protein orb2 n=5 Tax=Protostomia TaxID=33317 RepID=A0A0L0C085_LUCCU|nr:putative RNA-binding protein orb2 [Lucilia cuprina]